ncbi:MAG: hypothetical protein ACOCZ8_02890 [Bacteroidota bacterium]
MRYLLHTALSLTLALAFWSCREDEADVIYELNDVQAQNLQGDKQATKENLELISVAHTALIGETISNEELTILSAGMVAFGDQQVIVELIIRNFLSDPRVTLPSNADMRADIPAFVDATYEKFYVRPPTEYERHGMVKMITEDPEMTVEEIYFAFLTSNEYRYY